MWWDRILNLFAREQILKQFVHFILKNHRLFLFLPHAMCCIVSGVGQEAINFGLLCKLEGGNLVEALGFWGGGEGVNYKTKIRGAGEDRARLFALLECATVFYQ